MFWIGALTGFAIGFILCMFIGLTIVFYQKDKGITIHEDVNTNG